MRRIIFFLQSSICIGTGDFADQRHDGVFVVPIGSLKD